MPKKRLVWVRGLTCEDLRGPFVVERDSDYYNDLSKKLKKLMSEAQRLKADAESLKIIKKYSEKIKEAIRDYYHGNVISFHQKIHNLVIGCTDDPLAVSEICKCKSYPLHGDPDREIQFFRGRISNSAIPYESRNMGYLPNDKRGMSSSYRFSIPGVPSLYLCNSSYCCWLELGRPSEHDFVVSPVLLDKHLRIFNLAVTNRNFTNLDDLESSRVHCWLKFIIIMVATSYQIKEDDRKFKSEYLVSQSIMLACHKLGLDGVTYYSKRVDDDYYSFSAINLALFVDYKRIGDKKSLLEGHYKIGDSYNYQMFKQLTLDYSYDLIWTKTGLGAPFKASGRPIDYQDTYFYKFDQFLYSEWKDRGFISC